MQAIAHRAKDIGIIDEHESILFRTRNLKGSTVSGLAVAAVKTFLGDAWRKFETASITTVIRIKAAQQLAPAA
jgi:hypothetical protein